MKILHKILCLPVILMALAFTACDRDYDMPPLNEPKFELPADAQTITIKQLRENMPLPRKALPSPSKIASISAPASAPTTALATSSRPSICKTKQAASASSSTRAASTATILPDRK